MENEGTKPEGKVISIEDAQLLVQEAVTAAVALATATPTNMVERIEQAILQKKTAQEILDITRMESDYVSYLQDNLDPALVESVAILAKAQPGVEVETPFLGNLTLTPQERGARDSRYTVNVADLDFKGQVVVQEGRDGKMSVNLSLKLSHNAFGGFATVFKIRESNSIQNWSGRYGSERRKR